MKKRAVLRRLTEANDNLAYVMSQAYAIVRLDENERITLSFSLEDVVNELKLIIADLRS